MLQKFKITSYAFIAALVLVFPSQAVAQCNTLDACEAAATDQGLQLGGNGYAFAGSYGTKGCYSYESGKYQGMAYFGTGGTETAMRATPAKPKYRIETSCEGPQSQAAQAIAKGDACSTSCFGTGGVRTRHDMNVKRCYDECMDPVWYKEQYGYYTCSSRTPDFNTKYCTNK